MTLKEFISREASLPGYPGACCRMADKWFEERTGFSALRHFGRDFHTEEEVRAWLAEPGSIAVAVNRVMRATGYRKTKTPEAGDVGLAIDGKGRLCMSIHAGDMWLTRDESGLIGLPVGAIWKAWHIPDANENEGAAPEE